MYDSNPYYSPEKLNLDMISFDEPDMSYEYNTAAFFKTPDGRVFFASDSGCSCPTPFEYYEGNTMDEVIQKMEQMKDFDMAEAYLRSWGMGYRSQSFIDMDDVAKLKAWF